MFLDRLRIAYQIGERQRTVFHLGRQPALAELYHFLDLLPRRGCPFRKRAGDGRIVDQQGRIGHQGDHVRQQGLVNIHLVHAHYKRDAWIFQQGRERLGLQRGAEHGKRRFENKQALKIGMPLHQAKRHVAQAAAEQQHVMHGLQVGNRIQQRLAVRQWIIGMVQRVGLIVLFYHQGGLRCLCGAQKNLGVFFTA